MKVLFTFGGMPHYLNAMLEKLQAKGADITVVSPRKGNATIGKGVKMVEEGAYRHLNTQEKKMYYGKSGFPALPDIIADERPDIVVLGWPYFLQVFFQPSLRRALKRCGARLVIREIPFQTPPYGQIRDYFRQHPMYDEGMRLLSTGKAFYLRQWLTARIRKYCYARVAGTLNYSTAAYDILPSYGVKREQIHVTYNSTDTEALWREKAAVLAAPALLPPSERRLLHIGRLVKWKRVDLLIEAFARTLTQYPDAELVIVGNGPELDNLKKQAASLGLPLRSKEENGVDGRGCVRFIGAVYDPKELGAYMNEATVYVLAGMGGLSINDAMTYALPVVCSVCDSTERDLVTDGRNGLFFRDGDADSLTEKILQLLASPQECRRMGQESERIIREQINIDTVTERYLKAFADFLRR
ncbi:glycosyltransferase family 4 protein [Bacteroides ndongoniae]|uniref:glycosyltransferase family 4 protein n=1 Tax=Bacteroides ndongoniae TaxID=1903262 RepID=UPI0023F6438D|nr:glycosyltransferase family 4 protein [Bacteroides ndongoniae]